MIRAIHSSLASRASRGFTLIEVMVVVAIIGVLAFIAVPSFFKTSQKGKAEAEVNAVLTELALKEEQYKQDNGAYLAVSACPTTSSPAGVPFTTCSSPWTALRVVPPLQTLRCSYAITAGTTTGTNDPDGFVFTSPAAAWFYIIATCDTDGSPTLNSKYFISSISATIQKKDVGQ